MSKSYTVTQRIYCYDTFEEEDIPEGMTPAEYAEERYCEETGDPDSHTLLVFEDNIIIYDEENPENVEEAAYFNSVVPDPSDDDLLHDALLGHYFSQGGE